MQPTIYNQLELLQRQLWWTLMKTYYGHIYCKLSYSILVDTNTKYEWFHLFPFPNDNKQFPQSMDAGFFYGWFEKNKLKCIKLTWQTFSHSLKDFPLPRHVLSARI